MYMKQKWNKRKNKEQQRNIITEIVWKERREKRKQIEREMKMDPYSIK